MLSDAVALLTDKASYIPIDLTRSPSDQELSLRNRWHPDIPLAERDPWPWEATGDERLSRQRILATIPVLAVVDVFVFSLLRLTPGDPAAIIAGDYANPKDVAQICLKLELDQPLDRQFAIWLSQLSQGDLGTSIFSGPPVTQLSAQRLEPTLALAVLTMIIAIGMAISLGTLAAWNAGMWIDRGVMIFAVLGFSLPVFWLSFLLIYAFAMQLSILLVQAYVQLSQGLPPFLKPLILPALTLRLDYTALITRMTRASELDVLQEDYIRTAHAKGPRSWSVLVRHALMNAALPVVTTIGVGFALLIGGAVVTESVLALPSLGRLSIDAILHLCASTLWWPYFSHCRPLRLDDEHIGRPRDLSFLGAGTPPHSLLAAYHG